MVNIEDDIYSDHKLIAEFMGIKFVPFEVDWNWLMEIVSKIEKMVYEFNIYNKKYSVREASDGHDYYGMRIGTGGYGSSYYDFHYPDCRKCIKRDSILLKNGK